MFITKLSGGTVRQLLKFCLVGAVNTAVDFIMYISLTRGWSWWAAQYLLANAIAFLTANIFSFIVNKSWTFDDFANQSYHWQYLKFFLVSVTALLLVEGVLFITVYWFDGYDLVGKALGTVLAIIWSFVLHRRWTFQSVES
ncbi:GtrA family protein [Candidatus Falkowbacteria bacterium]|nr:GtrA family protein [Candidatus Falkowbacteria bacterium]